MAVHYQASGMETQAEHIYRSILSEYPAYPDALHLLGKQNTSIDPVLMIAIPTYHRRTELLVFSSQKSPVLLSLPT